MICELRSLLNPNNQEEEKNPMRPPLWHPPIELSDHEALIIKRIKRAKLFTFLRLNRLFIFQYSGQFLRPRLKPSFYR